MFNNKSNTFQAFWIVIGSISSLIITILSLAILSRYFEKTEYGTYRQILYVYNTLLIIFTAGLPRVFSYFLPRYPIDEGKAIIWKISKVLFGFGLLFSIFLYLSSGIIAGLLKNPELEIGLKYFSPIPLFTLPTLGIEGIFSTYKKTIFIALFNTLNKVLMLAFIVLPVVLFKGTYLYAIYGWLVVSVMMLVIAFFFKGIPFKKVISKGTSLSMKQVFSYSVPLMGASIAGIAISSSDQFFISHFFGADTFADYANGFIQMPFITMIVGATSTVLMPEFTRMIKDNTEHKKLMSMWVNALVKSAVIIFPSLIFVIFNSQTIIILLFSEKYLESAVFFKIGAIQNFFQIIAFAPLLFSLGKMRFYFLIHLICAILKWGLSYFCIMIFDSAISIAILSVFITVLYNTMGLVKVSQSLKVNILDFLPSKKFFTIIFHAFLVVIIVQLVAKNLPVISSYVVKLILNALMYGFILILSSGMFRIDYLTTVRLLLKRNK